MAEETVVIKIRFPKKLHEWIKWKSKRERRTQAEQITFFIERAYEEEGRAEALGESEEDAV